MKKNKINLVKKQYEIFEKIPFPNSPDRENVEHASTFADLALLDANMAGIIHSYLSVAIDEEKKELFFRLKSELKTFLDSHKDKEDEIVKYFKELLKIVEMIEF